MTLIKIYPIKAHFHKKKSIIRPKAGVLGLDKQFKNKNKIKSIKSLGPTNKNLRSTKILKREILLSRKIVKTKI